jgi:hypothetical protein
MKQKHLTAQGIVEYLLLLFLIAASTALVLRLKGVTLQQVYQKAVSGFRATPTAAETTSATPTETPTSTPTLSTTALATVTPTGIKPIATEPKPIETAPPDKKVYVSDTFQDLSQWKSIYGKNEWEVKDGWLYADSHGDQRLMNTARLPDDYTVTLEQVQLLDGNGYGIMFRLSPSGSSYSGYSFQVDPGYGHKLIFRRYDKNGYELGKPIAVGDAPAAFGWNSVHKISVSVKGDTFKAYIDDRLVLTAQDSTYLSGGVGLRTWDSARVRFSGFSVTPPME